MTERLRFGTAGLRAALGEGPLCMNVHTVWLAATAIAQWLPAGSAVVIGRDARHGSEAFATVTARVMAEHGHQPHLFADPVPTPVVAHAVSTSNAAGGVMVTASHNPATDNGYKVYAGDGSQILPDAAAQIEALMDALAWPDDVSLELPDAVVDLGAVEVDAYLTAISRSEESDAPKAGAQLHRAGMRIAYTAMHGVGGDVFVRALEAAGHEVHSVPEQHQPDPEFPTAAFPNPEEPGTLDLVTALAEDRRADLVLANDPDADRLAVAVRRDDGWDRLTGDQIGVLLGWYLLSIGDEPGRAVATTIVSSSMLAKVSAAHGATCHHTLTGFKWLMQHRAEQQPLVFAYEEALGYSVQPAIPDKDGISAGLVFAEMASSLRAHGRSIDDQLNELYTQHGVHLTAQVSVRFDEGSGGADAMAQMTTLMAQLRNNAPDSIGGVAVVETVDLINGGALPPSNVLIFHVEGGRVIIRPSGTEPKVKAYIEAVASDRAEAEARLDALRFGAESTLT